MSISVALRRSVYKRDQHTCQYCGITAHPLDKNWYGWSVLNIDHIYPRSLGGLDVEFNLLTACWRCNSQKGNRIWIPPVAFCAGCGEGFDYEWATGAEYPAWLDAGGSCFICPDCAPIHEPLQDDDLALEMSQWDSLIAAGWDVR